jgi:hypothetical protein
MTGVPILRQHGRTTLGTWPPPVVAAIADRRPFRSGALRGEAGPPTSLGRLPEPYRRLISAECPTYVVLSYATPIGWWAPGTGWSVPHEHYSPTTSRHQGMLRQALHYSTD